MVPLDSNTIYSCTDILFYAKTEHFLHTFKYFWENMIDDYANSSGLYKSINYKNIIDSNDNILLQLRDGSSIYMADCPQIYI